MKANQDKTGTVTFTLTTKERETVVEQIRAAQNVSKSLAKAIKPFVTAAKKLPGAREMVATVDGKKIPSVIHKGAFDAAMKWLEDNTSADYSLRRYSMRVAGLRAKGERSDAGKSKGKDKSDKDKSDKDKSDKATLAQRIAALRKETGKLSTKAAAEAQAEAALLLADLVARASK